VVVDCAELGYKSIAAHGHADALSIVLSAFGVRSWLIPGHTTISLTLSGAPISEAPAHTTPLL